MTKTEKPGCALGIAAALCVLAFSFMGVLYFSRMVRGDADSEALARDVFIEGRAPFGLVNGDATEFRGQAGAVVARFVAPAEQDSEPGAARDPEDSRDPGAALDVAEVPAAEAQNAYPLELILVQFHDSKKLRELFTGPNQSSRFGGGESEKSPSERLREWEEKPEFAWKTQLVRDKLRWNGWESDFQIHRSFTAEGTWSDLARINVGRGDRHLAVLARWPNGVQVTREDVRKVARTIRMEADALQSRGS